MTEHASFKLARAPRERYETAQQDEIAVREPAQQEAAQPVDARLPKTVLVQRRFAGRSPARETAPRPPVKREPSAPEAAQSDPAKSDPAKSDPAKPEAAKPESAKRRLNPNELSRLDLARLEALLVNELKRSPSPSIAANGTDEPPPAVRAPARNPAWPRAVRRAEPLLAARREAPELRRPADSQPDPQSEPQSEPSPEAVRLRAAVLNRLDARGDLPPVAGTSPGDLSSRVGRTLRAAATVFSLMALVGISALVVLLVAGGGERPGPVAAERASDTPTAIEQDVSGPRIVTADAARDESRIVTEEHVSRPAGTVRAADVQQAPADAPQAIQAPPADSAPAANAAAADEQPPAVLDSQSVFAPPVAGQYASAGQGFSSTNAGAAPAEEPAPLEPAAAETSPDAAGTHSAPVTSHVNLRASPDNDAAIVMVVPEGRNVDVIECTQWCEVIYDGRQGFIHRRFVNGAGG